MKSSSQSPFLTHRQEQRRSFWRYTQAVLLLVAALTISIPLHFIIKPENLVMIFLAVVVLAAAFLGRGPAILASVLSVLAFDYFLVEPRLSFSIADTQYLLTFFGLLTVGLVISNIVARLRSQLETIRERETHTTALNSLSRDLTGVASLDEMLRSVVQHIHQSFGGRVVVLLPDGSGLELAADSEVLSNTARDPQVTNPLTHIEQAVAEQVFLDISTHTSDRHTDTGLHFLALRTGLRTVGVLGIDAGLQNERLAAEPQRTLLQGFTNLAALAIERAHLAEQASQARVLKDIERLQTALLNSISHELRTPLVSITGALSTLADDSLPADVSAENDARRELVETAYDEARRMNLLVGNLLDMSRLESGALRLSLEPCDPQDMIGIALDRFGDRKWTRIVRTTIDDDLPLIKVDVTLIVEVLVNLLENAAKYSPNDSPIDLGCRYVNSKIEIEICDRGSGVPRDDLTRIFDKFYRSPHSHSTAGLGLGLSISKGIVEAHGGEIQAQNRSGGGLSVLVQLPATREESEQ